MDTVASAFREVLADDVVSEASSRIERLKKHAEKLLSIEGSPNWKRFSSALVEQLSKCISSSKINPLASLKVENAYYSAFFSARTTVIPRIWAEFYSAVKLPFDDPLLSQIISRKAFNELFHLHLKRKFRKSQTEDASATTVPSQTPEITADEENVVYYVGGYVVHALIRKYERLANQSANRYAKYLRSFASDVSIQNSDDHTYASLDEFVSHWLHLQDKGGLVKVNDEAFRLFLSIENVVRVELPAKLLGKFYEGTTSYKNKILDSVLQDGEVIRCWFILLGEVAQTEDGKNLLTEIISLWIHSRGHGLTSNWLERHKRAKDLTVRKSKGFRKSLSKTGH